jgi:hypothetical protein
MGGEATFPAEFLLGCVLEALCEYCLVMAPS